MFCVGPVVPIRIGIVIKYAAQDPNYQRCLEIAERMCIERGWNRQKLTYQQTLEIRKMQDQEIRAWHEEKTG